MRDGMGYIVAAYVVTWVMVLGYWVWLRAVARRARKRLAEASRSGAGGEA
jgi:hypothetical protein